MCKSRPETFSFDSGFSTAEKLAFMVAGREVGLGGIFKDSEVTLLLSSYPEFKRKYHDLISALVVFRMPYGRAVLMVQQFYRNMDEAYSKVKKQRTREEFTR